MLGKKLFKKILDSRSVYKVFILIGIQILFFCFTSIAGVFSGNYLFSDISDSISIIESDCDVVTFSANSKSKLGKDIFLTNIDYVMKENDALYDSYPFQCSIVYNEKKTNNIFCDSLGEFGTDLCILPLSTAGCHMDSNNKQILNQYYIHILTTNGISTNRPSGSPYCAISKTQADYLLSDHNEYLENTNGTPYDSLVGKELAISFGEKKYTFILGGVYDDEFGFAGPFHQAFGNCIISYYLLPNSSEYRLINEDFSIVFAFYKNKSLNKNNLMKYYGIYKSEYYFTVNDSQHLKSHEKQVNKINNCFIKIESNDWLALEIVFYIFAVILFALFTISFVVSFPFLKQRHYWIINGVSASVYLVLWLVFLIVKTHMFFSSQTLLPLLIFTIIFSFVNYFLLFRRVVRGSKYE